jgi:hypothetical protein
MFFILTFLMVNLYLSIVHGWQTNQAMKATKLPTIAMSSFVPTVCACMVGGPVVHSSLLLISLFLKRFPPSPLQTWILDDDSEDSPNALMNRVRAGFKCSPRFTTVGVEWMVVHIWFALPSIAMVFMIGSIMNTLLHAAKQSRQKGKVPTALIVLGSLAASLFVINLVRPSISPIQRSTPPLLPNCHGGFYSAFLISPPLPLKRPPPCTVCPC